MLFVPNNYQVSKTKRSRWLEKPYDNQPSHLNYQFDPLCRGRGGEMTSIFKGGANYLYMDGKWYLQGKNAPKARKKWGFRGIYGGVYMGFG